MHRVNSAKVVGLRIERIVLIPTELGAHFAVLSGSCHSGNGNHRTKAPFGNGGLGKLRGVRAGANEGCRELAEHGLVRAKLHRAREGPIASGRPHDLAHAAGSFNAQFLYRKDSGIEGALLPQIGQRFIERRDASHRQQIELRRSRKPRITARPAGVHRTHFESAGFDPFDEFDVHHRRFESKARGIGAGRFQRAFGVKSPQHAQPFPHHHRICLVVGRAGDAPFADAGFRGRRRRGLDKLDGLFTGADDAGGVDALQPVLEEQRLRGRRGGEGLLILHHEISDGAAHHQQQHHGHHKSEVLLHGIISVAATPEIRRQLRAAG
ncbi:MAG: hypothetical protein U5J83_12255 [Bryobacterales bacterium]|nr:hypothetical protein [Bryobacterales bacterium]